MIYYNDDYELDAKKCLDQLYKITLSIESLYGMDKIWYEKGTSRKQALKDIVFSRKHAVEETICRWNKRCRKNYPLFSEGIWDGGNDNNSCSVNYMKINYQYPQETNLEINMHSSSDEFHIDKVIRFMIEIVSVKKDAFAFIHSNGYWFLNRNVFLDRLCVGWMIYIPSVVLPELIPEAAKIVPIIEGGTQRGTIIVSTEDIFDGAKKEHIEKANNIEIKLLQLGYLPLLREL
ncbi:hypothetical protein CHU32_00930 [Superficieibacter electus]|uniref:Immunity protein 52 domain-containing protein n=2 Tax=Superficieibacter electus TaxID=2022662 RepID=A0A2P5GWN7_9ENTR|nr:hypothetical protein CHU33_00930 [Superficieibacter electus]POP50967.1 hypothetical protein CHU32_00930 [Superficieibacter electus]